MSKNPQKPIPLNYARPGTAQPAKPSNAPAPTAPGLERGKLTASEATVCLLETDDRADMAFATRALAQNKVDYYVADAPSGSSYKHPLRLQVREEDRDKGAAILNMVMERRRRAKALNDRKKDGFRTVSEGGTWPDPYAPKDPGPFTFGGF